MSDVTLYPIRGQMVQVKDKNEYIVYVPRADEYTYGTIKIGKGLISDEGVISVDDTQIVAIKTIAKNGVEIKPDENRQVNIVLTKADVGLSNVNNTADSDKPVSTATQAAIDKLSHDLMDDVMNVQDSLDDYKLVVDNKFEEQKSDVDGRLLIINNTISQNKTQTDSAIERIEEVLEGKEQAIAFTNYQAVVNTFNMAATNKYNVGQSIYVQSVNVPDLWVYSIENTHIDFAYIGDEDVIETLETNGTVQFGYYKLAMMETKTTSVANAATLDTAQTFTAKKTFELGGSYVVIDKDFATMQNKKSGGNRINSVYVSNGKTQVGSMDTDGTIFRGVEHDASTNTTNVTGTLTYQGKEVATTDQIGSVDATTLSGLIEDSDTIVSSISEDKVKFDLDAEITNKLAKTLLTPMSTPSATELVGVDNTNSQTMIKIGDGLVLEDGVIKSTGGGSTDVVTLDTEQTITGAKTLTNGISVEKTGDSSYTQFYVDEDNIRLTAKNSSETRKVYLDVDDFSGISMGSADTSGGSFYGIKHYSTGVTNITGTLQYNGTEVATKNDIQTAIQDSWEASY